MTSRSLNGMRGHFCATAFHISAPGGSWFILIPQGRLDGRIAGMLSYRFEQIGVYRFPEDAYKAYRQLVIFGVLKNMPDKDDAMAEYLKNCGSFKVTVPYLPENPPHVYEVPLTPSRTDFVFRARDIDPQELEEEIQRYGLFDQVLGHDNTPENDREDQTHHASEAWASCPNPGMRLDERHCLGQEKKKPLLIKGITKKEVEHTFESAGNYEKHIETDRIKITINAFNTAR